MLIRLEYDYRRDFEHYLGTLEACRIRCLEDILTPDDKYAALAIPEGQSSSNWLPQLQHPRSDLFDPGGQFGRETLSRAISSPITPEDAQAADKELRELSRTHGIDGALQAYDVDVLLGPGSGPLYKISAAAGEDPWIPEASHWSVLTIA